MTLTESQKLVFCWLNNRLGLPVYAQAYKGALLLLESRAPGYITFVSHTGRDFVNQLAPAVAGVKSARVQYEQIFDKLQKVWKEDWKGKGIVDDDSIGHLIPFDICQFISESIDEHKSVRLRKDDKLGLFFGTFFGYSDHKRIPKASLREWEDARDWFVKRAHLQKKPFSKSVGLDVEKHFRALDGLLYAAASSELGRLMRIDEVLEATNK